MICSRMRPAPFAFRWPSYRSKGHPSGITERIFTRLWRSQSQNFAFECGGLSWCLTIVKFRVRTVEFLSNKARRLVQRTYRPSSQLYDPELSRRAINRCNQKRTHSCMNVPFSSFIRCSETYPLALADSRRNLTSYKFALYHCNLNKFGILRVVKARAILSQKFEFMSIWIRASSNTGFI